MSIHGPYLLAGNGIPPRCQSYGPHPLTRCVERACVVAVCSRRTFSRSLSDHESLVADGIVPIIPFIVILLPGIYLFPLSLLICVVLPIPTPAILPILSSRWS